ncbi:MAG: glycosyltransferase family 2 protein [Lachnospiraceae bacterium]|nr:glycosyltransferase family 2 protein [Lachnospiraceae bacterium]
MEMLEKESVELSIIMPCLNEENTVGLSIEKAKRYIDRNHINGEIIIVDNGSKDASADIARECGARVILEPNRGYGNALRTGIANSRGNVIIMGDCDTTYDFEHLESMYSLLTENKCDMVIGNRYAGGIDEGVMPWSHKWGVRFLSFIGRKKYHTDVYDFHCGLRGFTRRAVEKLPLQTDGMEFATELIAQAATNNLRIMQVPVKLGRCRQDRTSKLRTVRDGFRHLKYIICN